MDDEWIGLVVAAQGLGITVEQLMSIKGEIPRPRIRNGRWCFSEEEAIEMRQHLAPIDEA